MMQKIFFTLVYFFLFITFSFSQNSITLNFGYGYFLHNSENSMKVMGDKKFDSHLTYGVSFTKKNIIGLDLSFDYSYSETVKENTLVFYIVGPDNPTIIDSYGADVSFLTHTFDLSYSAHISPYLSAGIGPTLVFANKIIELETPVLEGGSSKSIYDKLASACIGGNAFLEFIIPLSDADKYFFLSSKLKVRYAHSFWFDEKGRILDNYKQEFLDTLITLGLGYTF